MDLMIKKEWSQQDILNLIDTKAEENIHLDFKSAGSLDQSDKKKNEISKDISAFANSDGGVIIYGLSERNHVASNVDFVNGDIYTKEWLELVIGGGVQRPIANLRIFPVRFDNDVSKSVYVVVIPQSNEAPHITKDKKFYRRYNFQSVAMEEYEIRGLYNRVKNATLIYHDLEIKIHPSGLLNKKILEMEFSIKILNNSKGIANLYKTLFIIKGRGEGLDVRTDKQQAICSNLQQGYVISSVLNPPIFPGEVYASLNFILGLDISKIGVLSNLEEPTVSILFESGEYNQTVSLGTHFYENIQREARNRGYSLPPRRRIV